MIEYNKSFASQEKSKYWSDKNKEKPRNVFKSSGKKYWFNCDKCKHQFKSSPNKISNGRWCPYCGLNKLCDDNQCNICFNKSFASQEKSKYWSDKNKENPRKIPKGSHKKYWFNCDKCEHEFEKVIDTVKCTWCPYCKNKKTV